MWAPKFFKDVGKDVSDLFSDSTYDFDRTLVVKAGKGDTNIESKFETKGTDIASTAKAKQVLPKSLGTVEATVSPKSHTLKWTNSSFVSGADIIVQPSFGHGKKDSGSADDTAKQDSFVVWLDTEFKYRYGRFAATLSADGVAKPSKEQVFGASAGYEWSKFAAYSQVSYSNKKFFPRLSLSGDVNGFSLFGTNTWDKEKPAFHVFASHDFSRSTVGHLHVYNEGVDKLSPGVAVGGSMKLDSATSVKGFLDAKKTTASLLWTHEITPNNRVEVSCSTDFEKLAPTVKKWGVKWSLGDL